MNKYSWILILAIVLPMSACKWQDDFRTRKQPLYGDLPAKPTLNKDSEQYVGDKTASEIEGRIYHPETPIPEIDDRSEIPELPEHPVGI